ncbi:hypothetical protein ACHHYP_07385 [Achlya hypogyna]|uniref:Uncharacterized protein n=1 Tax=Achlya hypogyna TaxID=1202772 RepID=A0A1V9ZM16_ACHHY|nr:hypothetical protein ACHHYP_07385 [Achlya hypogyna]
MADEDGVRLRGRSMRTSVALAGLSGQARLDMIRQELLRAKETHPMRTEAKLVVRSFERTEKPALQRKHHAFVLQQRDRITDILARVQHKLDTDELPFHFGVEDREYVAQWIEDVEFILYYFTPQADPRNDPLGRMVDKLYWLHQAYGCFAEIGHDAKTIIDEWERLGIFEHDAFSDDDDDPRPYATLRCDATELDAAAEVFRKKRVLRRRAAARLIRKNLIVWLTTKHHVLHRMEEFRHFGNSFYKHIDNRHSLKSYRAHPKPRATQQNGMRLEVLQRLCRHVATFKVDDAIRELEIATRKRRLLEARCAVRIQHKWRSYRLGKSRMMMLIKQLQEANAQAKRSSGPKVKPMLLAKMASFKSRDVSMRNLTQPYLEEPRAAPPPSEPSLPRGAGTKKTKTRLRSIVNTLRSPVASLGTTPKKKKLSVSTSVDAGRDAPVQRRASIARAPRRASTQPIRSPLVPSGPTTRRGMTALQEEPMEEDTAEEPPPPSMPTPTPPNKVRRMSVAAQLVQAAAKRASPSTSVRPASPTLAATKEMTMRQVPTADNDMDELLDDEGISAWVTEPTPLPSRLQSPEAPAPLLSDTAWCEPLVPKPAREHVAEAPRAAIESHPPPVHRTEAPVRHAEEPTSQRSNKPPPSFRPFYNAGGGTLRLDTMQKAQPLAKKWVPFADDQETTPQPPAYTPMYELCGVDDDHRVAATAVYPRAETNASRNAVTSAVKPEVAVAEDASTNQATNESVPRHSVDSATSNHGAHLSSYASSSRIPTSSGPGIQSQGDAESATLREAKPTKLAQQEATSLHRAGAETLVEKEASAMDEASEGANAMGEEPRDWHDPARAVAPAGKMPQIHPGKDFRRIVYSAVSPPSSEPLPKWTHSMTVSSWPSTGKRRRPTKPVKDRERRSYFPRSRCF